MARLSRTIPDYETQLLQDRAEHDAFIEVLKAESVQSYLEIGLGWGGSLWRIGNSLPPRAAVVGLDRAPDPDTREDLLAMIARFRAAGKDAHLIVGDSTQRATIAEAESLAPFDCVFIDGDHSEAGVRADWKNYGRLARIVAFHDISWNETWASKVPGRATQPMGVPILWNELKSRFRSREIRLYRRQNYYGIGVLWREITIG
jgi:predicted O-methyltransferase YrrM